ncbi:hypothetical protein AB6A23_06590 [Paenibacillus tarimensis]
MEFEEAHASFIQHHLRLRSGERKGRLERGHGHGEILFARNVWWPIKGSFDDLHPEYEVLDWRGRSYFADFVFSPKYWRLLIEVKGYEAHVTGMDRKKYCNELNRELFLQVMGFRLVSFAYDDVAHRPEQCIHLLRSLLSRYEPKEKGFERTFFEENEVLRLAIILVRPIRPIDVAEHFGVNHRTAVNLLQRLCEKGWLQPVECGKRTKVISYRLVQSAIDSIS